MYYNRQSDLEKDYVINKTINSLGAEDNKAAEQNGIGHKLGLAFVYLIIILGLLKGLSFIVKVINYRGTTTGVVASVAREERHDEIGYTTYYKPTVTYVVDGVEYVKAFEYKDIRYSKGEELKLHYNKSDPKKCYIFKWTIGNVFNLAVAVIWIIVLVAGIIIKGYKIRK